MLNLQHSIHFDSAPRKLSQTSLHNSFHGKHLLNTIPSIFRQSRNSRKHSTGTGGRGITVLKKKNNIRATLIQTDIWMKPAEKTITVKGIVTVEKILGAGIIADWADWAGKLHDGWIDWVEHKTFLIKLVSAELDPKTGTEKAWVEGYAKRIKEDGDTTLCEFNIEVPSDYGEIGAVVVENEHHTELFFKHITLEGFPNGKKITITCESWVHSKSDYPAKRIFFADKSYLPSETPGGLKKLRKEDLENLNGDGEQVEMKYFNRIYDYDVYNDLGDPDSDPELARPPLGGPERPYPRRCRTGRPRTKADPSSETRVGFPQFFYIPRDEAFSAVKQESSGINALRTALHALVPTIEGLLEPTADQGFPYFTTIDTLFNEGVHVPKVVGQEQMFNEYLPRLVKSLVDEGKEILLFETPEMLHRDKFAWLKDEEFSRQTLAGLNPYSIRLVKESEWPFRSSLDPEIYGNPESLITKELVERQIRGFMTVDEALKNKKLFMLDYHDLYLPYVNKVREIKGTTLYGSRTLFFLAKNDTLRPIAIELTRPPNKKDGTQQWRDVYTPYSSDATNSWLWKLAKAHVGAHDAGYHQLVSHWLRTHCCTEPYVIATNRQLSAIHPIYRLLHPHFRFTMEMNALARQSLINAGGTIEKTFTPRKYSLELSSVAYDKEWRFDMEALPADLIRRGMAVEDPSEEHGLKLTIKDYPFANDGLILWDAIKTWVSDYVNHYYPNASLVQTDTELQAWWTEIRTVGHGDKKDEPWWPKLETPDDLINILTIIIWVGSGHHAAVNFGQYHYGGYFPNRPTIARTNMPNEEPVKEEQFQSFLTRPEDTLMKCFPSRPQATLVMIVLDILSNHSPDEEYIGTELEPSWDANPNIKGAFERFQGKLIELEGIIDIRNADLNLKNRSGAGVVPYELLRPRSEPGVTGRGVPNSISI